MALHPVGITDISAEALTRENQITVAVHAVGLLSLPVVIFGLFGLSSRAGWHRPSTQFVFITYCLSVLAVMIAAAADGLTAKYDAVMKRVLADEAAQGQMMMKRIEVRELFGDKFMREFIPK